MEWTLENPRAFQRQHMPHMGPISGVVCKGYFARGMQERGQIMTIFVLLAMDINPTLCDSLLPSRVKVQ